MRKNYIKKNYTKERLHYIMEGLHGEKTIWRRSIQRGII